MDEVGWGWEVDMQPAHPMAVVMGTDDLRSLARHVPAVTDAVDDLPLLPMFRVSKRMRWTEMARNMSERRLPNVDANHPF